MGLLSGLILNYRTSFHFRRYNERRRNLIRFILKTLQVSRPYDNLFLFLSFTFKLSVKDICGKCTAIRREVICQCDFEC